LSTYDEIDVQIIENIRKVFSITKQLPPIASFNVLNRLQAMGSVSQQTLADSLNMKPQSLSENIKKLEKNGFITRTPSEADKRVLMVSITDKGVEEIANGADRIRVYCDAFLSDFDQSEKEVFLRLLEKMIASNESRPNRLRQSNRPYVDGEPGPVSGERRTESEQQMICSCRGRRCVVTWDDEGEIRGYGCMTGFEGAQEIMEH